ncbi:MAG: ATP phosphoribosyltransferase [Oscillospiraceae bacterium]|nr:ATP phosphoribosyltransferase [Oscillospiraceae bacterium]MBP5168780.1 ATP phosphoribosyltransferase [Oscillospiraceae bacterium]
MLNIALPKGRLGEQVYGMLKEAGYPCPALEQPDRRLIFENEKAGVRYFWVKPHDVTIYVERGAADVGIAGKDILLEYSPELFELLDLKAGNCRMCVAGPADFRDNRSRMLRVATKFPRIAGDFYAEKSRDVELIKLNGSIELAPILGLSDVIVDIVETGRTLFENGLTVLEEVCPISARLVANPAAYRFRREEIDTLTMRLGEVIKASGEREN